MVVAALATADLPGGAEWLQPVEAQIGSGSVSFESYATIGIVNGERVSLSVANTKDSALSLSFSYYYAHGTAWSSVPLYESDWTPVPSRQIWSAGFSRADLKTEGDPVTGRAEALVKVKIIAPAGSSPNDFPISLEVFNDDVQSGESVEPDSKYRLFILAANRPKLNAPISFTPGESLNYSLFYPSEEGTQPIQVRTYVYDSYGNLLSQTYPVVLRPGDGHTFKIKRDDLRVGTGRLLVLTGIQCVLMDGSMRPVKLQVSMEHVNRTGSTTGGNYFTGSVTVSDDGFGGY
jgi:hypothetical protein